MGRLESLRGGDELAVSPPYLRLPQASNTNTNTTDSHGRSRRERLHSALRRFAEAQPTRVSTRSALTEPQ